MRARNQTLQPGLGQWGRSCKQKGSAQQKSLPTPPIEISVPGIENSIGGFVISKGGLEKPVPGLVKPASSTGGTGPGIFRLFAAFKRTPLDTNIRPQAPLFAKYAFQNHRVIKENASFLKKYR